MPSLFQSVPQSQKGAPPQGPRNSLIASSASARELPRTASPTSAQTLEGCRQSRCRTAAEPVPVAGNPAWDDEPVAAAHNLAQLLLFGASDCARALVRLFTPETTPVYAHTVLARASLELASRAWWLLEPTIGVRLRVARGINERLFSLSEQARLPIEDADRERARERRAGLLDEAERLGFRKNRSRPKT